MNDAVQRLCKATGVDTRVRGWVPAGNRWKGSLVRLINRRSPQTRERS
jgi:hypothetical protein